MMVWVMFLALALFVLLFYERHGVREAVVYGAVVFSAALLIVTELLSAFDLVSLLGVLTSWVLIDVLLLVYLLSNRLLPRLLEKLCRARDVFVFNWFLPPIVFSLLVTLCVALLAAPNNFDSMTYHMTRVAFWIQNQSVEHFPTHNTRQLFMSPWVEYVILHLQILNFASDRFANLIQWATFLGTMIAASLIVARLGGSRIAQWFAALLVATTPVAILQASSTQTDLACSCWILVVAWLVLELAGPNAPWRVTTWGFAGLALGLAIATKGTAYVYCAPFLLGLGFVTFTGKGFPAMLKGALVIMFMALTLNAPHYYRNFKTFAHPLGDPVIIQMLKNQRVSLGVLGSNLLRNVSLHLHTPFTGLNAMTETAVTAMHRLVDVDPSDPATTWGGRYHLSTIVLNEDFAGNFLLFNLIVMSSSLLMFVKVPKPLVAYAICVIAGFVLFALLFKWQVWGSRLQLPVFMLYVPVCALVLADLAPLPIKFIVVVSVICFLSSILWLFYNTSRPIFKNQYNVAKNILYTKRISQYFNNQQSLEAPFYYAVAKVNEIGCRNLGIMSNPDSFEYPLVGIQQQISPGNRFSFHHLFVRNRSADLSRNRSNVCAILAIDQAADWRPAEPYDAWRVIYSRERIRIYAPVTP